MCHELLVLVDESDVLTKDEAMHFLALHLAHHEARCRGMTAQSHPQQYAEFVFPRSNELERKLRAIIAIGPP